MRACSTRASAASSTRSTARTAARVDVRRSSRATTARTRRAGTTTRSSTRRAGCAATSARARAGGARRRAWRRPRVPRARARAPTGVLGRLRDARASSRTRATRRRAIRRHRAIDARAARTAPRRCSAREPHARLHVGDDNLRAHQGVHRAPRRLQGRRHELLALLQQPERVRRTPKRRIDAAALYAEALAPEERDIAAERPPIVAALRAWVLDDDLARGYQRALRVNEYPNVAVCRRAAVAGCAVPEAPKLTASGEPRARASADCARARASFSPCARASAVVVARAKERGADAVCARARPVRAAARSRPPPMLSSSAPPGTPSARLARARHATSTSKHARARASSARDRDEARAAPARTRARAVAAERDRAPLGADARLARLAARVDLAASRGARRAAATSARLVERRRELERVDALDHEGRAHDVDDVAPSPLLLCRWPMKRQRTSAGITAAFSMSSCW